MTWKQFKAELEAKGVKDDMQIAWIDTHLPCEGLLRVSFSNDLDDETQPTPIRANIDAPSPVEQIKPEIPVEEIEFTVV